MEVAAGCVKVEGQKLGPFLLILFGFNQVIADFQKRIVTPMGKGVAGNRIKTLSYGKERPIEVCSEESCYAQNRRAVTVLTANVTG